MNHWLGVCAILFAAALYLKKDWEIRQSRQLLVQDFLDAIESMETAVRWENATLPDVIQTQEKRKYAGSYFEKIGNSMKGGIPLQTLWNKEFSKLDCRELSRILCAISLCGDSEFLQNRLAYAAMELREFQKRDRTEQKTKRKLKVAAALSSAGMMIILLL